MARIVAPSDTATPRPGPPAPALRHLVWLKWTLTRRGLARDRHRLIGAIVFLLFLIPAALVMGGATFVLYRFLPRGPASELMYLVLACLFVIWVIVPLFFYTLNESLDVSRLFLYPIRPPRLMAGLLLTSVFDLPVLFVVALFAAVLAGWITSWPTALIVPLALAVLYGQMVAAGQGLLALLDSLLRSRRFRDLSIIGLAVFGSSFYLWQQLALRQLDTNRLRPRQILDISVSPWLGWTPPGTVARAIAAAGAGDWPAALLALSGATLYLLVLVVVWHRALTGLMTSAETGGGPRRVRAAAVIDRPGWRLPVPRPILALATKDLRYFWRDPQLKAMLVNIVLALGMLLILPWFGLRRGPITPPADWLMLGLPLPIVLTTLSLAFNAFGMERGGLRVLFLLPVPPVHLLLGKNLAVLALAVMETPVIGVSLAAFSGAWALLPAALVATIAAVLVTLAVGNAVAVLLPARLPEGNRATYAADTGCARGLLQLAAFLAAWLLILPIGAAIGLPTVLGYPAWHLVALPLALAYGVALYAASLRLVGPLLLARQPEILALVTRD